MISEFLPLTPFKSRSRSARPTLSLPSSPTPAMQRSRQASVARLYDWSDHDQEQCLSVSRLYREMAGGGVPRSLSEKVRVKPPAPGAGQKGFGGQSVSKGKVNPGRMFLRDKGVLTKGEREIIEGIYKNRGDLTLRDTLGSKSEYVVRSHHDAWLVGKPISTTHRAFVDHPPPSPRPTLLEVTSPVQPCPPSPRLPRTDVSASPTDGHGSPGTTCIMCLQEQLSQPQQVKPQPPRQKAGKGQPPVSLHATSVLRPGRSKSAEEEGPTAPPSSPDCVSSCAGKAFVFPAISPPTSPAGCVSGAPVKGQGASPSPPPAHAGFAQPARAHSQVAARVPETGAEHQESQSDGESSQDSEGSRRKLRVQVYLPKVVADTMEEDFRSCEFRGQPALTRERPLSNSDLRYRHKHREATGSEEEGAKNVSTDTAKQQDKIVCRASRTPGGTSSQQNNDKIDSEEEKSFVHGRAESVLSLEYQNQYEKDSSQVSMLTAQVEDSRLHDE